MGGAHSACAVLSFCSYEKVAVAEEPPPAMQDVGLETSPGLHLHNRSSESSSSVQSECRAVIRRVTTQLQLYSGSAVDGRVPWA